MTVFAITLFVLFVGLHANNISLPTEKISAKNDDHCFVSLLVNQADRMARLEVQLQQQASQLQEQATLLQQVKSSQLQDTETQLQQHANRLQEQETKLEQLPILQEEAKSVETKLDKITRSLATVLNTSAKQADSPKTMMSKLIMDKEGYYLAFRLTAGIRKSAYNRYTDVGNNDDDVDMIYDNVPCGCKTTNGSLYCNRHYRSVLLDYMPRLPIEKVKVCVHEKGTEKMCLVFDGKGSDYKTFFQQSRLIMDPYTDLSATTPSGKENGRFFSIDGYSQSTQRRRFFINKSYNGCPEDVGWLVVADGPGPGCKWETDHQGYFPYILYANMPSHWGMYMRTKWQTQNPGEADVLTISIKLKEEGVCEK